MTGHTDEVNNRQHISSCHTLAR